MNTGTSAEAEHPDAGELHVWGATFSVKKISVAIQVSDLMVLTTAALVDLEEVPLYAVTLPFKFASDEAMQEGIEQLPARAVKLLHDRLIEDGMVLADRKEDDDDGED